MPVYLGFDANDAERQARHDVGLDRIIDDRGALTVRVVRATVGRHLRAGMKRIAIMGVALGCASVAALAHQAGSSQQSLPVFRSGVQNVEIDVVVLDKDGKAVHGLTKSDFTVLDRKQPRTISDFAEITHAVDATPEAQLPPDVPRDVASNTTPRAGRLVVLMVDETVPDDRIPKEQEIARQVVQDFGDEVSLSLLTVNGVRNVEVTDDRAVILRGIDQISKRSAGAMRVARDRAVETGSCPFPRLIQLADVLRSDDTQRKAVVFISPFCRGDLKEVVREMEAGTSNVGGYAVLMIEAFRRANVAFYAIDPRGPADYSLGHFDAPDIVATRGPQGMRAWRTQCVTRACDPVLLSQDNLRVVTEATGGFAITNTNEIKDGIAKIVDDFDHYYLLSFDAGDPTDKSYRPIEVTVNRPGVTVRYRRGYQLGGAPAARKNQDPMVTLSQGVLPHTDLPLHMQVMPLPSTGKPRVAIALQVDERPVPPDTPLRDHLDITVLAANLDKSKVTAAFLRPRDVLLVPRSRAGVAQPLDYQIVTTVPLSPGKYQLRVSAKSSRLDRAGSVYATFDVPDYSKMPVALGSLVLGYADATRHPVSTSMIDPDTLPFEPVLDRTFARSDSLRLACDLWRRDPAKPVTMTFELLDGTGARIASLDQPQPAGQQGGALPRFSTLLDLAPLVPGPYELRLTASDGKNSDSRSVGIVVK